MTKKKLVLIGGLIVLCLLVGLCTAMCTPAEKPPVEESVATQPTAAVENTTGNYTIEIKNEGGQPLEEIGVYIYTDSTMQELVWFAKTDAEGRLNFQDAPSNSFVAVLDNVPAGYLVEEFYLLTGELTQIVLQSGLMEGNLNDLDYKLGDLMMDFTAVAPDGTEYVFSELLEQKKAIVLNFWYLQCQPCKAEFPYLQEAYENYDEDLIVLAMNPVNQEDGEIDQFRQENGYTFPMMKCDPAWEKAMGISAYPTTVVIDRFGNICMIHTGSIPEVETFESIFQFFTAEDYTQTFVRDIEELEELVAEEQVEGTKGNPIDIGVSPSFQMTLNPKQEMHFNLYRITGTLYMSLNEPGISLLYNGKTYNSPFSVPVTAEGTSSTVPLVFTNTSAENKSVTVYMGRAAGSYDNPYSLKLGDFTAKVPAGSETGIYYIYTAGETGLFKITVDSVTAGVNYNIVAYNLTSYAYRQSQDGTKDEQTGYRNVGVNVTKGDRIQVIIGTLPDSNNTYPAANFKLNADILEGESEGTTQQTLISYSVNVTDENRKPIPNVKMTMKTETGDTLLTTNTEGFVINRQVAGVYTVVLTVPYGYSAKTTEFTLTEQYPSVSVKLDTLMLEEETYTIRVTDAAGNPIVGAFVSIGTSYGQTDENGVAVITAIKGDYMAQISADGYALGEIPVSADTPDASVSLEEGESVEKIPYSVKVVDHYGNAVSGLTLTFKQSGAVRGTVTTDEKGEAETSLAAATYEVSVPAGWYAEPVTLTAENTSADMRAYAGVNGETGSIYGTDTYVLYPGATYVEGLQSNTSNYFLFVPEVDGLYRFTGIASGAEMSYWGNNTSFVIDLTANTDYDSATNSFTLNIKPAHLGSSYVLGLTSDTWGIIVIERIGDSILDVTDMEETPYERQNDLISNFRLNLKSGESLEYIDIFGETVTYVRDEDGFYHLNSVDGPQLYVNLGDSAKYLSMSKCMGVTDEHAVYKLVYVYYDEQDNPVLKESYNPAMIDYVNSICPNTEVYPLNDDLVFILQRASQIKGWGDYNSVDFLFYDDNHEKLTGVNEAIAWMYAVCYVE